jgi:hypothetical protein
VGAQYCQPSDIAAVGVNPVSLTNVSAGAQQNACVTASGVVDSYLRGRYSQVDVPPYATSWGPEITLAAARIAAEILMTVRGYRPDLAADENIKNNAHESRKWLGQVQRQAAHPSITFQAGSPPQDYLPQVATGSRRGWGNRAY